MLVGFIVVYGSGNGFPAIIVLGVEKKPIYPPSNVKPISDDKIFSIKFMIL